MNEEKLPGFMTGMVGFIASLSLADLNGAAAFMVASITILALVPLLIRRWRGLIYDYKTFCHFHARRSWFIMWFLFAFSGKKDETVKRRNQTEEGNGN